jgi:sec-independent protein translocase protein TatA
MPNIGLTELLVILAILVLLFGAKRIPDLAEGVGKALRRFKDTQKDENKAESKPVDSNEPKA